MACCRVNFTFTLTKYSCDCLLLFPCVFPFHYDIGGYILDVRFTLYKSHLLIFIWKRCPSLAQYRVIFISNCYTRRMLPDFQHPVPYLEVSYTKSIHKSVKYISDFACAFYGCETWSRVTGSTQTGEAGELVMGRYLDETGSWRKLHNVMHALYSSPKSIRMISLKKKRWTTHVTRTLEKVTHTTALFYALCVCVCVCVCARARVCVRAL
jgi:hypothetical protein